MSAQTYFATTRRTSKRIACIGALVYLTRSAAGYQVGYGFGSATKGYDHALLWNCSAVSDTDLGALLPASFNNSFAYSISGDTVYGWATDSSGNYHAIAWSIPEPTTLSLATLTAIALLHRRRRANPREK